MPLSSCSNPVRAALITSLEQQLSSTRQDLSEQYKIQSTNSQRLLNLTDALREAEERSREEREELTRLRTEVEGFRERARWHSEIVQEKEKQLVVRLPLGTLFVFLEKADKAFPAPSSSNLPFSPAFPPILQPRLSTFTSSDSPFLPVFFSFLRANILPPHPTPPPSATSHPLVFPPTHRPQILQDDHASLTLELTQLELRNEHLATDNAALLQRWLESKAEEAMRMNEANVFVEEAQRAKREREEREREGGKKEAEADAGEKA